MAVTHRASTPSSSTTSPAMATLNYKSSAELGLRQRINDCRSGCPEPLPRHYMRKKLMHSNMAYGCRLPSRLKAKQTTAFTHAVAVRQ